MENLKKSFLVRGNNIVGLGGSGEENTIESISVNGVDIAPDENKNIDITVPSIDGLTKDADLATVAKSGNYEDLNNKPEIPSIEGLAKTTDIPTKVSQLENDSKYQTESDVTITLTDYATKTYVGEQITNAEHLKREIVTVLPSDEEASDNIIYMLKVESATGDDKYQEYMKIDGTVQMVGDTSVDLTDYAKTVDIPTTVAELTDSADYAKSADIPTTLPANGGNSDTVNNHTVETNVPADAVFTDTIYDDTEVKEGIEELNSNLETLEYGKIAGGKQLHDGKIYHFYQNVASPSVCTAYDNADSIIFETADLPDIITVNADNSNRNVICYYDTFPAAGVSSVTNITEVTSGMPKNITVDKTHKYILIQLSYGQHVSNVMVNEGNISVPYEPYIPTVKMLAEEVNQQNENLDSQGLLNKFDGKLEQGYKNSSGTIMWDSTNVCIKNTISVSSGDKVTVKLDSVPTRLYTTYRNNGVFVSEEVNYNTNNVTVTIPSGANGLDITMVYDSTTTPSQVGNLYVYINNAIEELKNDLDGLEYSENAGGKNLVLNTVYGFIAVDKKVNIDNSSTSYIFYAQAGKTYSFSGDETPTAQGVRFAKVSSINPKTQEPVSDFNPVADGVSTFTTNETGYYMLYVYNTKTSGIKFQIEEGTQVTQYEPYIPSVKMLAEKTTQIDDLNVLGWVVPEEMPIKNYTDSDGVFHQIVGRVDLGTLDWTYDVSNTQFYTDIISQIKQDGDWIYDVYCSKYITSRYGDKRIALNRGRIYIGDSSYTNGDSLKHSLRGVYLYFELSTPITMNIDGNEAVTQIKNDLSNFTSGQYIDGSTDWNTIKTSGMYYYNGWSGSGGSNKPAETKTIGMAFVLNTGNVLLQFAVLSSGNSYFRNGTVDEPGSWVTMS